MKLTSNCLIGLLLLCCVSHLQAQTLIYRFAQLIDGTGKVLNGRDIAVDDGLITAIGNDLKGEVIDLGHLIALPGLIDAHTHVTYGLDGKAQGAAWQELGQVADERRIAIAQINALKTLQTGVTTIRDLNPIGSIDFELRQQIELGQIVGPRIFTSGPGIHPSNDTAAEGESKTSVEFVRKVAQQRMQLGTDWIKIFATSGSADDLTSTAYYPPEAIKVAANIAHENGKRITIHSYGPEAVDAGIAAGVDSIDHPSELNDAQLQAMRDQQIIYVPTIDHNRYYADHAVEYGYDKTIQNNLHSFIKLNLETTRRAHQAGVTIAMGSDAVMSGFGDNTCELAAFRAAGLTAEEIIQTATLNGAKLLGEENRLGRLHEGFVADIVAVSADPLEDINNLIQTIQWVMKEGSVVVDSQNKDFQRPNCGAGY